MIIALITLTVCSLAFSFYVWKSYDQISEKKAEAMLAKWKEKEEKTIREDAYQRSRAVSFGKTIEHYVPFMENFPVDPKDAKFFGKPIDYVAFTEMGSKSNCAVHFIEVKSGSSNLNSRQDNIKKAIIEGRIHWHEYNVDGIWTHETKDQHLSPNQEKVKSQKSVLKG
jgi:predicted Holliday junction resolvase-like endonuclease